MNNYDEIIQKAKELAGLIEKHPITKKYHESMEKMKMDIASQKLLERLVRLGEEISLQSKDVSGTGPAERELISKELEENDLVKSHLLIQKEYLDMINKIQYKIKNPL